MQYARLGDTGLVVSRLCLGAMTFGVNTSRPELGKVDEATARKMVEACLDAGVNFFDTADAYGDGQSEMILGRALASRRSDVVIATKAGFRTGRAIVKAGLSRRHLIAACEASLKRLNTDYIDLYQVHKEDAFTPLQETMEALDNLVTSGKVRYVGFSNWAAWRAATALQTQKSEGLARFVSGQYHYSLLIRDVEHEIAPFFENCGVGMMVWSPLAGGFLSGKYSRETMKEPGNRHADFDIVPFDHEAGFALVERMRLIADELKCSIAQLALAWLLSKQVVSSVVVGSTKLSQLSDNLVAADVRLPVETAALLDSLTVFAPQYPSWFAAKMTDRALKAALQN